MILGCLFRMWETEADQMTWLLCCRWQQFQQLPALHAAPQEHRVVLTYRMASPASVALLDIAGAVSQLADGGDAHPCCSPGLILPHVTQMFLEQLVRQVLWAKTAPSHKNFLGLTLHLCECLCCCGERAACCRQISWSRL